MKVLRGPHEMEVVYLGLGTNVGDRLGNLFTASKRLESIPGVRMQRVSSVYETEPLGMAGAPSFLNAACSVITVLSSRRLHHSLEGVESGMGRLEKGMMKSRIIDLDLLMYGSDTIQEEGLIIPHPRMHLRRFVLVPLSEIAPEAFHPVLGKNICDILLELGDENGVRFYSQFPTRETAGG